MADIDRIKGNIGIMIDAGATEAEIDQYIAEEGITLEQLNPAATVTPKPQMSERQKVASGSLIPFSRYSDGEVEFDPDAGIIGSLKRVVSAPAEVLRGELDPMSQEGQMRALEFATAASPVPVAGMSQRAASAGLFSRKPKVPTQKELGAAKKAGYKAARELGVEYDGAAVANWARGMKQQLDESMRIAETYPEVHGLLDKLTSSPANSTVKLGIIEELYKELGRLAGNIDPAKASAANIVQKSLDDFHANLGPDAVRAGATSPYAAAQILKEARGNAAAEFRSKDITGLEKTIQRRTAAAGSGRNIDNQIRQRLTTFIESRKGSRGLTKAEEQAIDDIIMGKPTKNALRYFGNLFGGGGGIMSSLQAGAASGIGYTALGPAGIAAGLIPPAIGATMRQAGGAIAKREVKNLDELMRSRSPLYQKRLGNEMPVQVANQPPANVPLLPSPVGQTAAPIRMNRYGRNPMGTVGLLPLINEQNRNKPGLLTSDDWI